MSKKFFSGLVLMMVLSIIGITWVQIIWIRNAIDFSNQNFNSAVFNSLTNAAGEIESVKKLNFFNNFPGNDHFMGEDSSSNVEGYVSFGSYVSHDGSNLNINIDNNYATLSTDGKGTLKVQKKVYRNGVKVEDSDTTTVIYASPGNSEEIHIPDHQQGDRLSGVSQQKEYINWLKKRSYEFRNMSSQMISEIYEWEKAMDLDKNEVESTLIQSLNFSGINTPFEFAIIKDGEITDGKLNKRDKSDFLKSIYKVRLFPDNIIKKDMVISVVFPERRNYVLGSMTWILGGSLMFSLFIFSTFALSLYFIIRQKKISEMKSDFINNMTHEFKTPIATISLAADTITNSKVINDEKSIKYFIGMIKKENSRMNKQVETILQIASLEKKEIDFKFENTSVHSIIERAVETIEIQVQQRQGRLRMELNAANDIIKCDAEHLMSLVHNLLDNAIKYSSESPEILVNTENRDEGIVLSVEDKGIGMSKSVQSKIFERFYRQSSGDVHNVKGFGLGLNYVRAIVDAHKGVINVFSEPGKGSRFEIYLPFNPER